MINPETRAEILRLREQGLSLVEIAKRVDVGKTAVQGICAGVPRFNPEKIMELYRLGVPNTVIGRKLGCCTETVSRVIRKHKDRI